jgi:hypothetical protein
MFGIKRDYVKLGIKMFTSSGVGYIVKSVIDNMVVTETPKQKVLVFAGRIAIGAALTEPINRKIDETVDAMGDAMIAAKEANKNQNA